MKAIAKLKWLIAALFIVVSGQPLFAQTKIDASTPITWLGLDYSQAKIIGQATQWENAGKITNAQIKDIYTVSWNELFINEQKKYDIAEALHRSSVKYDIDVALKANAALDKDFFSNNPGDFKTLDESKIAAIVSKYDFGKNDGVGLIFFVEGLSKANSSEGFWITFVDMKSKKVISTTYRTAKPGGFGFRNYWAKPIYTILKEGIKY
jgi:hypothetical protein